MASGKAIQGTQRQSLAQVREGARANEHLLYTKPKKAMATLRLEDGATRVCILYLAIICPGDYTL